MEEAAPLYWCHQQDRTDAQQGVRVLVHAINWLFHCFVCIRMQEPIECSYCTEEKHHCVSYVLSLHHKLPCRFMPGGNRSAAMPADNDVPSSPVCNAPPS